MPHIVFMLLFCAYGSICPTSTLDVVVFHHWHLSSEKLTAKVPKWERRILVYSKTSAIVS
ncbi:hypothetical protein FBY31_0885 [Arthrobacter sp. SLBN-100]|nr:hypothetical protein FBY31_0885 [Arthrobacter sp. SLBN-100]